MLIEFLSQCYVGSTNQATVGVELDMVCSCGEATTIEEDAHANILCVVIVDVALLGVNLGLTLEGE